MLYAAAEAYAAQSMLALLRQISLQHWKRAKLRSALVVLGIALGVALYVATEAASAGMARSFDELVERVSGRADLVIEGPGQGVPSSVLERVAELDGVAHAASTLEVAARAVDLDDSLLILGVDFLGDTHFLPFKDEEGKASVVDDPLTFVNDPSALLVSVSFAQRHGLSKGDSVRLLTADGPKSFKVFGLLEDKGPVAGFGGQVGVMFLDAAQISFARGHYVDRIDVAIEEGANARELARTLQAQLGEPLRVGEPASMGARLRGLASPLRVALWLSGFLAIWVGAFLVYNAVAVAVAQRRHEIGVLRALGATERTTTLLFCLESLLLAVPGTAIGLVLGSWLSRLFSRGTLDAVDRLYANVRQVVPELDTALVVRAVAAGLLMALVSAFLPARRGASADPVEVLRGTLAAPIRRLPIRTFAAIGLVLAFGSLWPLNYWDKLGQYGQWWGGASAMAMTLWGAVMCTPAIVLLLRAVLRAPVQALLGIPGRLGLDYVARTLGRSSINVLALMVSVGMSVAVGGWLTSLERALGTWADQVGVADLSVTQGSPVIDRRHVPFSAGATDKLAAVPGVHAIQRFRMLDQQIGEVGFRLVATETQPFLERAARDGKGWQVIEGEPLAQGDLIGAREVLLSQNAATRLQKSAGDTLSLTMGDGRVPFLVRAVVVDYSSEQGSAFIDRSHLLEISRDEVVDGVLVYAEPKASLGAITEGIRNALAADTQGALFITQTEGVEAQIVSSLRETFSYSTSSELLTLVIALMGVVGTMAAAVVDRKREIGMLRAVGATSAQVTRSMLIEAGFLGLCAVTAGIALGSLQCVIFLKTLLAAHTGWHLEMVFPWQGALRTSAVVIVTSAIAGALPALRTARAPDTLRPGVE